MSEAIPQQELPADPGAAQMTEVGVDWWWSQVLTPQQRLGLWVRYGKDAWKEER